MKKIYFSLMLMGALAFTSCSMDQTPYGSLDDKTAIRDVNDLGDFRNQLYSNMRSVTSGVWLYRPDIQMDEFHGLISNANREGVFSTGQLIPSSTEIESFWLSGYTVIANCNAVLEHAATLSNTEGLSAENKVLIDRYAAEAHFVRAYMYFWMADHFCQSYTQTDPDKAHSGMPLTTTYNPSGDVSTYPSRSTLNETYALIENDLKEALTGIQEYEATGAKDVATLDAPNASYISSYAVQAMQARVALVKGDWATAASCAEAVINSNKYQLTTIADYKKLWTNDEGTEVIYRPYMSNTELGGSNGAEYISDSETTCDYIPTYGILGLYTENDVRFETFFKVYENLQVEGSQYIAYVLNKFPGNEALRTGATNNIMNMSKPFRLSEMYLIAAEAEARQGHVEPASNYLNTFLKNRLDGYRENTYASANSILPVIKEEREKEFVGEGMRMSDIRRYGEGFERYADHEENEDLNGIVVKLGRNLKYSKDDYRLTWPIPKAELDANTNLAGQQNPGY